MKKKVDSYFREVGLLLFGWDSYFYKMVVPVSYLKKKKLLRIPGS